MLEHIAHTGVTIVCPVRFVSCVVYTAISTYNGIFIAQCNGCDFANGSAACTACRSDMTRRWEDLHRSHPDLSASQLKDLQP